MEIRNRLFPYPVLCKENDDYKGCKFDIKVDRTEELNNIVLCFDVELDNNELLGLIRSGQAEYIIHIECSNTSFRKVVHSSGKNFKYSIPKSKVNKDIYLVGMVVAKECITKFYSHNFNEDYEESVAFEKGAILAYVNLPRMIIYKNYEELASDNSFFSIIKKISEQDTDEPVTFELNGDKIKILVGESVYDECIKFYSNPMMKPIIISILIMPALAYVIEEIRRNGNESYIKYYWYQKIKTSCELKKKRFIEDIIESEATSIEISQEMLQLPIGTAFRNLDAVVEE